MLDNFISAADMAEKLGYNKHYLNQLANAGKIPALKRGRVWLFDKEEVLKHLQKKNVQKLLD